MFRQREQVRLFDQGLQGRGHVRIARRLISRQNASVSSQIGNMLNNRSRRGHTHSPQWRGRRDDHNNARLGGTEVTYESSVPKLIALPTTFLEYFDSLEQIRLALSGQ